MRGWNSVRALTRIVERVRESHVASDVDFDGEAQVGETARCTHQAIELVENQLQLCVCVHDGSEQGA